MRKKDFKTRALAVALTAAVALSSAARSPRLTHPAQQPARASPPTVLRRNLLPPHPRRLRPLHRLPHRPLRSPPLKQTTSLHRTVRTGRIPIPAMQPTPANRTALHPAAKTTTPRPAKQRPLPLHRLLLPHPRPRRSPSPTPTLSASTLQAARRQATTSTSAKSGAA